VTALLSVRDLAKHYPMRGGRTLRALAGVSFDMQPGAVLGIVGESGSGKTTLGRVILRLMPATSGTIRFRGQDITRLSRRAVRPLRRHMQIVFQDPYASLNPRMTVEQILGIPLGVHEPMLGRTQRRARIEQMLHTVGLFGDAADRYPHEFSGGQRQRIGIARALICRPELLVADEPVSALDVSIQAQILNLMLDLQRDLGLTYLFISHDLSVVRYMSESIGVMYLGKLVEVGPADEVYYRPVHPYTRGLIDTVPVADPVAAQAREDKGVAGELPSAINPPSGCRFRTRCPRAQELCAAEEPPLRPFTAHGHLAACHFPLREPEGVTPVAATP